MAYRADRDIVRTDPECIAGDNEICARRVEIRGVVQGVGFRPFVYRLALGHGIAGWVRNTSWGVEMEVGASSQAMAAFLRELETEAPPISRIESLTSADISPNGYQGFDILHSEAQPGEYQLVSPDVATCADCLREVLDAQDRRYRYPFTNCTNCGPRFTIIEGVPYDRSRTTMRSFRMCPTCQGEYDDPLDRRFHAQPNACPTCGPRLMVLSTDGRVIATTGEDGCGDRDAVAIVASLLRDGRIVAIKGLGGFQLACDATNHEAVRRLRVRKQRPHKPFAVMVADIPQAESLAVLSDDVRELLTSPAAPIVLAHWRRPSPIADQVAPATDVLGLMLPYTPLHHLLLRDAGIPLVMTSGNVSEEPIARDNDEALSRLARIADAFLMHDRGIYSRYDDSVWFVPEGGPQPVRRARGYAPFPIRLSFRAVPILACGPELKNTFCLTRDKYAFVSQHIGDMGSLETLAHYEETLSLFRQLFHVSPEVIACDMHPEYATTRYGQGLPGAKVSVQHHHAHLAACLIDRGVDGPVIGAILDGTGYGLDGHTWGGEFLVGDARGFQRAAHLEYLPLPGGDAATHKPYRIALAYTQKLLGEAHLDRVLPKVPQAERAVISTMVERGLNTPLTSSMGRLFDAVSALLGVRQVASYEAQSAIELEMVANAAQGRVQKPYPFGTEQLDGAQAWGCADFALSHHRELRLAPLLLALLQDLDAGIPTSDISWRFHLTIVEMIVQTAQAIRDETGLDRIALSGGCFQNRLLLSLVIPMLRDRAFKVLTHKQVPTNDGGVSLGQAAIAHYRMNGV